MDNFQNHNINISYENIGEEAFCDILNPLLKCAKIYRRSVGFFSSSSLEFIGEGIVEMVRNGGRIFLATSPKLSQKDIDAINNGYSCRKIVEERFFEEVKSALYESDDDRVNLLYELVKEKYMDVKVIVKDKGMYHDKLAILEDFSGNIIACVGSNNESAGGYHDNYEKVRVYKSWTDLEGRIDDETNEFKSIWENSKDTLEVFDFQDAFEKKLLERIEYTGDFQKKPIKYEMRPYQDKAKEKWIENGCKGFFVMATGTGKTITALNSIKELITENHVFTVIAVPYKHLVNQWYEDAITFFPDANIQRVFGEIKDAEKKIYAFYKMSKLSYRPTIVITTITSFTMKKYKSLFDKINYDKLLIVDEAHNFSNQTTEELSEKYMYKLGLSATPVFGKDESKTADLLTWFGGIVADYPIEKAIGKYLVNYEYHPIFVNATEHDEEEFNKFTKMMLSAMDANGRIINEDLFMGGYRGRLRAISMAEEKISNIEDIFLRIDDTDHTIIYCSDGKLYDDITGDNNEVRHLEYILKLINHALTTRNGHASKFTASEDANTRMRLIEAFNKGYIDYLVAIKCLDEGINIPSIRSALILSSNDNYREFVQRRGRILRQYEDENGKKELAHIYDVIVLPSSNCTGMAKIELRRYLEYSKLALNHEELLSKLDSLLDEYELSYEDISFDNVYVDGGALDE